MIKVFGYWSDDQEFKSQTGPLNKTLILELLQSNDINVIMIDMGLWKWEIPFPYNTLQRTAISPS